MKFIEKTPIWLRWILFFPLSLLSSISVYLILNFVFRGTWNPDDRFGLATLVILTDLAAGFVYVKVGASVVPHVNLLISILLILFIASIAGCFVLMAIIFPDPYDAITNGIAIHGSIAVLGSLIGLIMIWKKSKKAQKSE
jgi:hypothetical protein